MGMTRRQAIIAGVGTMVLSGCASTTRTPIGSRPAAQWPGYPAPPANRHRYVDVSPTPAQPVLTPGGKPAPVVAGIVAIDRANWTRTGPVKSKVNPMKDVNKITLHHEGWNAVWFNDQRTTAERIEKIRKYHVGSNRWGDIGYHYIIDRAGRVWEGRDIGYQGAHVRDNNENNVGILVLGNFQKQSPSDAQLRAVFNTTKALKQAYRVKPAMVRSHKEINPTTCPGKSMQRKMDALRKHVS